MTAPQHGAYNGWCRVQGCPVKADDCPECMALVPMLLRTTEVWTFDPPVPAERSYSTRPPILVHQLHRSVAADGSVHLSVKGQPTTSTGKTNGGIDWRHVTDDELQRLHQMVLHARSQATKDAAQPTNP